MKKNIQLITLVFASIALTFSSCKKAEDNITSPQSSTNGTPDFSEKGTNPDDADMSAEASAARHLDEAYLYTESNGVNQNDILCYKQHSDGSLTLKGTTTSGGTGIGSYKGFGLDGQGALALSDNHEWLYAVNAGSNSISSFKVHSDGSLTLAHTESSGGQVPISLCIYHHYLYVVNDSTANISGYTIGAGGTLTAMTGANLPLSSSTAHPAQIGFSPNGEYLYITERGTNSICSFDVNISGLASFDQTFSSTGVTPFGFSIARNNFMVVSNANMGIPNSSSCTSYSGVNPGTITSINGAVANYQTASCWLATTKYGRFAYTANTGSDNISSYYVAPWGGIYLVHPSASRTGTAPKDLCVTPNNYYVYVLNTGSQTIGGFHRAPIGDLVRIGTTPNLPQFATGLVAW